MNSAGRRWVGLAIGAAVSALALTLALRWAGWRPLREALALVDVRFLFLGVATCIRIMMAFTGSFQAQLQPFLAMMLGGGVGLYVALGARNPSAAIGVASFVCPLATYYAITSYMLDFTLAVCLVIVAAYGFATAAMLMPAIYEFDVATGRTTVGEDT
mgnify:CR=1 FL=1